MIMKMVIINDETNAIELEPSFPLQYLMGDIIVTQISMQALEDVMLIPANHTNTIHRFTVTPPLPIGLHLDPSFGLINGHVFENVPKTLFTISLHTVHHRVDCLLMMEFAVSSHMALFHGHIVGSNTTLEFRAGTMDSLPIEWQVVPVGENGLFELHVLFTAFQLRVNRYAYVL